MDIVKELSLMCNSNKKLSLIDIADKDIAVKVSSIHEINEFYGIHLEEKNIIRLDMDIMRSIIYKITKNKIIYFNIVAVKNNKYIVHSRDYIHPILNYKIIEVSNLIDRRWLWT